MQFILHNWTNNGLGTNLAPEVDMSWHTDNGGAIYQSARLLGKTRIRIGRTNDVEEFWSILYRIHR